MSKFVANVCIGFLFVTWTLLSFPVMLLAPLCTCIPRIRPLFREGLWYFGFCLLFLLRPWIPVHTRAPNMARTHPGAVLICNHQSFLDLYLFAAQGQRNLCFVTKHWPFERLFFLRQP